jgi:hypothetical protein
VVKSQHTRSTCLSDLINRHRRVSTMSSSEGENFDLDNVSGSESDGYTPAKKKTVRLVFIS